MGLLAETLGNELLEGLLFGSVARGESWPSGMRIRSDLDLLVITREPLGESVISPLLDATLPLFLESGRQICPQFRSRADLDNPKDDRAAQFIENVRRDGIRVYP